jgi:hypothetical protein
MNAAIQSASLDYFTVNFVRTFSNQRFFLKKGFIKLSTKFFAEIHVFILCTVCNYIKSQL